MDYDQRMIIKFLLNERVDARNIADRLQAQFSKHAYKLRTIQFWITEVRLSRQDLHDEIRTGRLLLDDLDAKIVAILNKYPFESSRSIAETLCIAHSTVLLHLHNSVDFKSFHLHWMPHMLRHDLHENERSMPKRYCYSCILPNVISGIMSWPMMSHGFSWMHHHVACRLCREMTWSQSRDLIFRTKRHVHNHMESERLLCYR
jgi:hypothetical protein